MVKLGLDAFEIWQQLKNLRMNIKVATKFPEQVKQIDRLYSNDKTGLVSTIIDYKIHASTVDFKIETKNETLNEALQKWQKTVLNRKVNIDIPGGLRALSVENFRERWRSSLLALKVIWGQEKFANQGTLIVPKKMWFLDGASISSESTGILNTRKYFVTIDKDKKELKNTKTESIFIRKPYTAWHKNTITPFLVQRGTVFNTLIKNAIVQKQSDVIEAIIPILLKLQAGNDQLALEGMNPSEEQFKKLKDQIVDASERFKTEGNMGDLIASLRHDVSLDYLIPDLEKVFDEKIVKSTDRNLLSSLGMIELKGFSSTREESILNPKVLVEEVVDAVKDWANLLQDVMLEMMERNKVKHPNLANNTIQVIPGTIKAFLTEEMKSMLRSMYDRGIVSHQNATEDIANLNFEVQLDRNIKEDKINITEIMKPPVIQNIEKDIDPEMTDDDNLEDQDKKPGTPEADNFNNALLEYYGKEHLKRRRKKKKKKNKEDSEQEEIIAPFKTIDELPDNVKNVLPVPAQIIWMNVFNSVFEETSDEERAIRSAWSQVSKTYEKVKDKKKWVKKAKLEDYKSDMSSYAYKLFTEMYETALEHSDNHSNAIKTALIVVEKVCTKNNEGILVKDKTTTKATLEKIDRPDFVSKILDLELQEKKLKLIDKLLKEEE